jgi:hypothetical protein
LEFDEESCGKRWFSWQRDDGRSDRRLGVAATTIFLRETHFFSEMRERFLREREERERRNKKYEKNVIHELQ